ncbi:Os12g0144401 [Oryza sativa Japonica Group]|uniref:Os12g0144401 protein n=1 Tax=Oryza sativa subsp. japonica TaxID=39947 RepID=A0A0P0Y766_ORYSJ|nr:hypothetical protein EE612_057744 [Oryza sativa]BAT15870.1 Os12g0144401 [Oryza sativa Japonica Group]
MDCNLYDVAIVSPLVHPLLDHTSCHGELTGPTNNSPFTVFDRHLSTFDVSTTHGYLWSSKTMVKELCQSPA